MYNNERIRAFQEQENLQDAEDRCDQLIKSKVELDSKIKGNDGR